MPTKRACLVLILPIAGAWGCKSSKPQVADKLLRPEIADRNHAPGLGATLRYDANQQKATMGRYDDDPGIATPGSNEIDPRVLNRLGIKKDSRQARALAAEEQNVESLSRKYNDPPAEGTLPTFPKPW